MALWKPALAMAGFLVLRLMLVVLTVRDPTGGILTDSKDYLALSRELAQTGRYIDPSGSQAALVRPPGYPVFLAVLDRTLGGTSAVVTLAQLALTGLAAWSLVLCGRLRGRTDIGLAAGWILALSPNAALWSLTLMSEALFGSLLAFSLVLWVWALEHPRPRTFAAVGLSLGVAALVRPIGLLLIPAWAAGSYFRLRWRLPSPQAMALTAIFLAAGGGVSLGWMLRNQVVEGQFVFTTVSAKTMVGFDLAEVVARGEGISRSEAAQQLEGGSVVSEMLEVARSYPVPFVQAQLLGVARTAIGTDIGTWGNVLDYDRWAGLGWLTGLLGRSPGKDFSAAPASSGEAILRYGLLGYGLGYDAVLGILCLAWLALRPGLSRRVEDLELLPALVAGVLIVAPLAAGQARFRVPAEPFLALLASAGLAGLLDRWRNRRPQTGLHPVESTAA